MTPSKLAVSCRVCRSAVLEPFEERRTFRPPVGEVTVRCLRSRCTGCGCQTTLASQHEENLRRLAARAAHYGPYLLGEDILHLRTRYGLTQKAAARILGVSTLAFSRYEAEKSYPDLATTKLFRLALRHPRLFKELADDAGEPVPLWEEREKDLRDQMMRRAGLVLQDGDSGEPIAGAKSLKLQ